MKKINHIFVVMKGKWHIIIFCFISSHLYAQITQKGVVVEMSSDNQPIPGVEIRAIGAVPTDSDQNGFFILTYPEAFPGDPLIRAEAYKHGFEIVNNHILSTWNLTESDTLKIVLGRKEKIDALRRKYHEIGMTQIEREYAAAMEKLRKEKENDRISAIEYDAKRDSIAMEMDRQKQLIEEYATRFARINTDVLEEYERRALQLLQEGRIYEAIGIYEGRDLIGKATETHLTLEDTREDIAVLLGSVITRFRLHQELEEYEMCDSLAAVIEQMAPKNDIRSRLIFPEWLAARGRYGQALAQYSKLARECSSMDDIAIVEFSFHTALVQCEDTGSVRKVEGIISERKKFIARKEEILK